MSEFEARVRQLSILYELSTVLNGSLDLDRELEAFLDALTRTLSLERAAVFELPAGEPDAPPKPRTVLGLGRRRRDSFALSVSLLHRLREAPGGTLEEGPFDDRGAQLSLLIFTEAHPVGVLTLASAEPLDASDRALLQPLGRRLAVALHHERLRVQQRALDLSVQEALRQARDAAVSANRIKSEFLATISHELRTPLHGVMGMSALLLDSPLDPRQTEQAQAISRSASALLVIVDDLLDLSRMESGRMELETTELDLGRVVREALSVVELQAQRRGLELSVELPPDLPRLRGDPLRLRQILLNLLGNAVKFTERGSVRVEVSVLEERAGSLRLVLQVIDTGIGLPAEVLPRLFSPFTQADGSMSRRFGGSGLGLSIVQRLVGLMGGEVGVESVPGQGSRFRVTLELARSLEPEPRAPPSPAEAPRAPRPPAPTTSPVARVLVAEDNAVSATLLRMLLERDGYEVDVAGNGVEACDLFEREDYDVILMDCQMPEMDGYQATRRIRAAERDRARGSRAVIVAVTANASAEDRQRCLESGMDSFVSKPFTMAALQAELAQAATRRR
jgi:signal transduction histidine kinase/ActR/RegA family two-component response regulator